MGKSLPRHLRIRILDWAHYPSDARQNQGRTARRRAAVMRMRLQRNVSSRSLRAVAGLLERVSLRMSELFVNVKAFANNFTGRQSHSQPADPETGPRLARPGPTPFS